jgi:hypothetical protein
VDDRGAYQVVRVIRFATELRDAEPVERQKDQASKGSLPAGA